MNIIGLGFGLLDGEFFAEGGGGASLFVGEEPVEVGRVVVAQVVSDLFNTHGRVGEKAFGLQYNALFNDVIGLCQPEAVESF